MRTQNKSNIIQIESLLNMTLVRLIRVSENHKMEMKISRLFRKLSDAKNYLVSLSKSANSKDEGEWVIMTGLDNNSSREFPNYMKLSDWSNTNRF